MKKVNKKTIKWDNPKTDTLTQAFLMLRKPDQIKSFLRDLLTESEIVEFGNRFYAARMLSQGVHYKAIEESTGLSSTTIARVQKWLKKGMRGYSSVIPKLSKSTRI